MPPELSAIIRDKICSEPPVNSPGKKSNIIDPRGGFEQMILIEKLHTGSRDFQLQGRDKKKKRSVSNIFDCLAPEKVPFIQEHMKSPGKSDTKSISDI